MAVTISVKTKESELKNKLDEYDLLFVKMLRRMIIPPIKGGSKSILKRMSPAACKVYLIIWGLTSVIPTTTTTGKKLKQYVSIKTISNGCELSPYEFKFAMKELIQLNLIEVIDDYVQDPQAKITYNLTSEEMGITS